MSRIVFLDTETTGLDPFTEDVFEVAIINNGVEHEWRISPRYASVANMHPKAAEVNRFHERTSAPGWEWHDYMRSLAHIGQLLDGAHICGAVPDFDTRFLAETYKRAGLDPPRWHYHLIDIEAMAVGYLYGVDEGESRAVRVNRSGLDFALPWDSGELSRACGVEPPADEDRHTALGDARWVKRLYEAITGGAT